jgi:hypothetical protein
MYALTSTLEADLAFHAEVQAPLLPMIQSSPALISLKLKLLHQNTTECAHWDVSHFFEMLDSTFPRLRELSLSGNAKLD